MANQDSAPPLNWATTAKPAMTPITPNEARTIPIHMSISPPAARVPVRTISNQLIANIPSPVSCLASGRLVDIIALEVLRQY